MTRYLVELGVRKNYRIAVFADNDQEAIEYAESLDLDNIKSIAVEQDEQVIVAEGYANLDTEPFEWLYIFQ
jgi:hypothetical protein